METQFIGLRMVVTLKHPAGTRLQGTVSDVHAGTSLSLSNVIILGVPGPNIPRVDIDPDNIIDLYEDQPDAPPSTFTAPAVEPVSAPVFPQQPQPAFADPAILSVGARPASTSRPSDDQAGSREKREPKPGQAGVLPPLHLGHSNRPLTPTSEAGDGIAGLAIDSPTPDRSGPGIKAPSQDPESQSGNKNSKRRQRQKQGAKQAPLGGGDGSTAMAPAANRGKGWRQTPILESTASFQPYNSLKKNGAKGKNPRADNGWASEDVTEEMGEFDFESELRKFDKRTLFDQMRKQDQVDDADRLVSHNRRPKPGTSGGKNLHHTENVLDMSGTASKAEDDFWNSEADDGANGEGGASGRDLRSAQSNRRGESKSAATRRSQSRKASAATGGHPLNRVNSAGQHNSQPGFYVLPSNRRVETISALQMLNLENIAANDVGLTEDMTTENAGRGIAEVALTALSDPAIRVRMASISTEPANNPANSATIVILAGNNKSGIRAVAAGRHLRSRGANILLCLVGIERERDLLEGMRQQIRIYRNFGGRVFAKQELFDYLHKSNTTNTPVSVTLIVDALLGLTLSFEELRTGDQASVYELINWANRNEAFVLAVDVPTGIDPSTGKVNIIDRARLYVKPRYVVAMGAPKHGLLEAMSPQNEEIGARAARGDGVGEALAEGDDWRLFIADLGLGSGVWKKAGTKNRRGIDFDDKWVLEMRYQGPATDDED